MSTVTAKAFRQQILKPAEGIFLFHARAIERLIEEQLGERLLGVSIPDLPYYLMPRDAFLFGLESENAEALSVIEGLRLPDHVILLPSPATQDLDERSLRQLRHDYWARGFEAEVARAWQMAREDNQDARQFGADALTRLIGEHEPVGREKGDYVWLRQEAEVIGAVVRTRRDVQPLFVSIGHRICLETAIKYVLACATRYRLPETTRCAHRIASLEKE